MRLPSAVSVPMDGWEMPVRPIGGTHWRPAPSLSQTEPDGMLGRSPAGHMAPGHIGVTLAVFAL